MEVIMHLARLFWRQALRARAERIRRAQARAELAVRRAEVAREAAASIERDGRARLDAIAHGLIIAQG